MTTNSTVATKADPAADARASTVQMPANLSGIVPRDDRVQVAWFFGVCAVVLIAAGIAIPLTVNDGPWLPVMAVMGSLIIIALMSAAAVPHLKRPHHPIHH
ncbi:MAG: hypothetical protein ABI382_12820 [Nakamurella sp.]